MLSLKPEQISLCWIYLIGILFTGISILAIAFDFYFILLLPVALIGLFLLVFSPDKIIYFLAFAVPLSIPVKDVGGGFGLSLPTEPLIALLFCGIIFKLLTGTNFDRKIVFNILSLIIAIDLIWLAITAATSTMPFISFKYLLARSWYVIVFYFGLSHLFKNFKAIHIFIWGFCIATTILVLYTMANHAEGSFTRLYAYTAMRPFLPDHGMYAAAISFCIPPLFIYAVYGHVFKYSLATRIFALGLLAIITIGVVLSFTRASWLGVGLTFGIYGLMLVGFRFRTLLIYAVLALVVFLFLQQDFLNELSRNKQDSADNLEEHLQSFSNVSTDPSNLERLNRWNCALRMFQDKPVLGWGPGTYTYQYGAFQISGEMTIISTNSGDLGNVHSEYLRPLCESGVLGGLFFLLIVLFSINKGFYLFHNGKNPKVRYMALAAMLGLMTYFSHAVLNNYSEFDKIAIPMWGFMAILLALQVFHNEPENTSQKT
jgi:O-antigen ligase